jgi:NitT/TauT family transport system substrate-binding protein
MTRTLKTFLALTALIVLLSACSGAQPAPVSEPLNIAWTVWAGEYPHLIAKEKGFFEKRGLNVNLILYESQTPELADMQSGKIDGGVFSLTDSMAMIANNPDSIRIVMAADISTGADAIVAIPEIETIDDLKGERVAANLGSQTEFFIRYALDVNQVSTGDVNLIDMDPEAVPAALGNLVSAGHTWDPYLSEAVSAGNHVLFSTSDAPGVLADVLVFRKPIVDSRPEDVHAYLEAWFEALEYWQNNPEESKAIIAKYTGLTVDEVSSEGIKLLGYEDNLKAMSPGNDTSSVFYTAQLNLDFLVKIGAVSNAIDVREVILPGFIQ